MSLSARFGRIANSDPTLRQQRHVQYVCAAQNWLTIPIPYRESEFRIIEFRVGASFHTVTESSPWSLVGGQGHVVTSCYSVLQVTGHLRIIT